MKLWRVFFSIAAAVNLLMGAMMMAAPSRVAEQLGVAGSGGPYAIFMIGMMVAVFGLGYALTARRPAEHRGIVIIGAVGKLGAAALAAVQYSQQIIPFSTFALGMGDLVFALGFGLFLWRRA